MAMNPVNFRSLVNNIGFYLLSGTPVERVTNGVPVITTNHSLIHAKKAFSLKGEITIAQSKVGVLEITVPTGAYVHLQELEFISDSGPGSVTLIEDAHLTSAVGASTLTSINHHRIEGGDSVLTIKALADAGVTNGTSPVTLATLPMYGAGVGGNKVSANNTASQEYILKVGTHVLAFSHSVTGTCKFGYKLFWYEESGA